MTQSRKLQTSHVLLTLGVLFTAGGALRLLPQNEAAAEDGARASGSAPVAAQPVRPAATVSAPSADQVCFDSESAQLIARDLQANAAEAERLASQRADLNAMARDLERQAAELEALSSAVESRWRSLQAEADEDLVHLARMYGAMRADDAASIFDKMDPGFSAGFLRLMPSEQAGLILAAMDPEIAYVASLRIATMNQDIREIEAGN